MRPVRDTFLHFLADNLVGILVHPLRADPNNPSAEILQLNALNVQFLGLSFDTVATQVVSLDVLNDDENTAVEWVDDVWALLRSAFYIPLFNYSNPESPTPAGTNVMWDRKQVGFRRIVSDNNYCHYSCILPLKFYVG